MEQQQHHQHTNDVEKRMLKRWVARHQQVLDRPLSKKKKTIKLSHTQRVFHLVISFSFSCVLCLSYAYTHNKCTHSTQHILINISGNNACIRIEPSWVDRAHVYECVCVTTRITRELLWIEHCRTPYDSGSERAAAYGEAMLELSRWASQILCV